MKFPFAKYQGTGNDFIMVDNRAGIFPARADIQRLCDRRFGIGADGLILVEEEKGGMFMRYYNSDGRISTMCGNGGRCFAAFARRCGITGDEISFMAADGWHTAKFISSDPLIVRLGMGDVKEVEKNEKYLFLDTGSPHVVQFVDDVKSVDVVSQGRSMRYSDRFREKGTNVNFVAAANGGLQVRTYERGVEDETYSCGTGVTASALAAAATGRMEGNEIQVWTPGGRLRVGFRKESSIFKEVWLEGEATFVFAGEITI